MMGPKCRNCNETMRIKQVGPTLLGNDKTFAKSIPVRLCPRCDRVDRMLVRRDGEKPADRI